MSNEFPPKQDRPELTGPLADAAEAEEATRATANETFEEAGGDAPEVYLLHEDAAGEVEEETTGDTVEPISEPRPPAKLERLQKILAQAGIASRRHAEELITQGRVQVNGNVVTELGTKADAEHDHIRVDGKLLKGSERLRYFVLNKPKGFVTTVSDPEGRPTVMQFFEKMRERLYPVGRLDYASEGLLLVTNDGDLANKLAKAGSGVEKTYLVKVSGQPTEDALEKLRIGGVAIDRNRPGSDKVRTAPARIRMVRPGENPWYEVVLIEGRNRELRKMFEEVGHHVEKIRRVGYGPLVLDQEPGKLRELDAEEVEALRKAAEGKWKTPRAEEARRRHALDAQMQALAPPPTQQRQRPFRPTRKSGGERIVAGKSGEFRPKQRFGGEGFKGRAGEHEKGRQRTDFGREQAFGNRKRAGSSQEFDRREPTGMRKEGAGRNRGFQTRPEWKQRGPREEFQRPEGGRRDERRPGPGREEFRRPEFDRPRTERGEFGQSRRFERGDSGRMGEPRFDREGRSAGRFEPRRRAEGTGDVERRGRGPAERRSPGDKEWKTRPKFQERGRDEGRGGAGSRSAGASGSGPRSGTFAKSGFRGNAGAPGARRGGSRPPGAQGGKRRSGPPGGRKRK